MFGCSICVQSQNRVSIVSSGNIWRGKGKEKKKKTREVSLKDILVKGRKWPLSIVRCTRSMEALKKFGQGKAQVFSLHNKSDEKETAPMDRRSDVKRKSCL